MCTIGTCILTVVLTLTLVFGTSGGIGKLQCWMGNEIAQSYNWQTICVLSVRVSLLSF